MSQSHSKRLSAPTTRRHSKVTGSGQFDFFGPTVDLLGDHLSLSTPALLALFEDWVDQARTRQGFKLRDSSIEQYAEGWRAWVEFSTKHHLDSLNPSTCELRQFVSHREQTTHLGGLGERHTWRLLRLIERVLAFHAERCDRPACEAVRQLLQSDLELKWANARNKTPPPEFLSDQQFEDLTQRFSSLITALPYAKGAWNVVRNHLAVALHLGAGLSNTELLGLRWKDVSESQIAADQTLRRLWIEPTATTQGRFTPVALFAWQLLTRWKTLVLDLGIPCASSDLVFVSTLAGKPWGRQSHLQGIGLVMQSCNVHIVGSGAYKLRHTFAIRLLKAGRSEEDLSRWMGLDLRAIRKYKDALVDHLQM